MKRMFIRVTGEHLDIEPTVLAMHDDRLVLVYEADLENAEQEINGLFGFFFGMLNALDRTPESVHVTIRGDEQELSWHLHTEWLDESLNEISEKVKDSIDIT